MPKADLIIELSLLLIAKELLLNICLGEKLRIRLRDS